MAHSSSEKIQHIRVDIGKLHKYIKRHPWIFYHTNLSLHSTKQRITKTNRHRLRLAIIRQRSLAQLAPDATLLVTSKRQLMMQHVILIDPDRTSAQRIANADSGVQVGSVDGRGETVGGRVADADGVLFGFEFGNRADGAEDFFLHDLHVFADAGEDGGLDEVALLSVTLAADFDLGAFFLAGVDVSAWMLV